MKNIFFILLLFLMSCKPAISQEVYAKFGENFTKFKYKNTYGENSIKFYALPSLAFEAGLSFYLNRKENLLLNSSLIYNQYNAEAFIHEKQYNWKANYIGFQNTASFKFFEAWTSLNLKGKLGFNVSHIISGTQNNNNIVHDLTKEKEFKGIFIQPLAGLEVAYVISDLVYISFDINKMMGFNTVNNPEKLSFSTNQFLIGFHFLPR
ncbi:hypothetical protein IA01_10890 [Flavobacterium psychrophilum]|uniref:Outer membrane protein beta-barrel domain-containing protein n=5 Tax=Flavobacterium psychrophilum TaxID=96345 RepID=A6H1N3_FLAPJ|nr:hypothetical protein [Flavobacterium psychrophilum]AIG30927.1 hypothetical protein IA03_10855 [Flavobacterium psychrophilum]AIG33204.1 hypothetical protein IA01_10890 [Flavobacterium psychrophilum]AIG35355.1 hypothetical protein IA02_10265 [Flavobacterium psychrophilum]AIG37714.1 hypothetical protein IA04_10740 [Flavobacterium psychrophilum]AIG39987.1 hypothetical protein IA05_10870 [Flavobacterium psychrophilum]